MTAQIINLQDWKQQREDRNARHLSLHTDSYYDLIRRLAVEQVQARTDCGDPSTWKWEH